jgi:hypothetical protein
MFSVQDVLHDLIRGDDNAHRRPCTSHSWARTPEQTVDAFLPAASAISKVLFAFDQKKSCKMLEIYSDGNDTKDFGE